VLGLGFSARYTWWRRGLKGVPVLMYHHVTDDLNGTPLPKLRVSPRRFARQLDLLLRRGYRTLTLSQALALEACDTRESPNTFHAYEAGEARWSPGAPAKAVVLTFDDGYLDFYEQAWPLLRARGQTATVFLVTGSLGGDNHWDRDKGEPQEGLMTREQVLELDAAGVEFGGHTHSHRELTTLDERGLRREITGCQKALTDLLGRPSRVFSYPYGLNTPLVAEAVARAGFTAACTTRPGMLGRDTAALMVPRIIVKRADDGLDFALKLTRGRSRL
jgi:peptidoglycan/xylan/chitin deacetylase (PgdA/CDA1 family)